jgi:hypothetical protein
MAILKTIQAVQWLIVGSYNVLQLTDSFCFSQKFWLGAVIRWHGLLSDKLKLKH